MPFPRLSPGFRIPERPCADSDSLQRSKGHGNLQRETDICDCDRIRFLRQCSQSRKPANKKMIFPLAALFLVWKNPKTKARSRQPCACEKEHGRRRARSTRGPAGCRAPRVIRTANLVVVPEKAHRPLDSSRSSGFPGARPRVDPPRLRGPQKASLQRQHHSMPPTVATSTRADAPAARKEDAPKRKRELNARVVRPPRRPGATRDRAREPPAGPRVIRPRRPLVIRPTRPFEPQSARFSRSRRFFSAGECVRVRFRRF